MNVQKIYASVGQMNAGFATDGLPENAIVMISTGNPNDADNAKVYRKGVNGYEYMVDLSGATGPKGDKGDPGEKGDSGKDGTGVTILGSYTTEDELYKEHPTGNVVENSGTETDAVFDFEIPRGTPGELDGIEDIPNTDIDSLGGGSKG